MNPLTDDKLQDEILKSRIEKARHEADSDESDNWDALNTSKTPKEKLSFIVSKVKLIAEQTDDADAILGKIIDELLTNSPEGLISNLRFIQRFRNHDALTGESAYTMTLIMAAIQQIDKTAGAEPGEESALVYSLVAASSTSSLPNVESSSSASFMSAVFSTIGFVPRAITSAFTDTISKRASTSSIPAMHEQKDDACDDMQAFRREILSIDDYTKLTIEQVKRMFHDYQKIIKQTPV